MAEHLYNAFEVMPRNLKRWTKEETEYLLAHHLDESRDDLGRRFGCSAPTVSKKLLSLGIRDGSGSKSQKRVWTDEEIAYLKEHYPYDFAVDIGDHLGVSDVLVRKKALELGLKKSEEYDRKRSFNRYVKNYKHNLRRIAV